MTLGAKKDRERRAQGQKVPKATPAEKEQRLRQIMDLHASGDWAIDGRKLARALAQQWGVAVATVEAYSCEANRLLNLDRMNQHQLRDAVNANLWDIVRMGKREKRTDDGKLLAKRDLPAANQALRHLARINGLEAPQRHVVAVTHEERIVNALTEAELERFAQTGQLPDDIDQRVAAASQLNGSGQH